MIELLAPAGSMEALKAAVESGANAIYLSGKMFGARAYADNFDEDSMREAIKFAHLRNVKINVTVNTIVENSEIPALAKYLNFLYEAGADAILVQDLGAARLAQKVVPDLPLHASTQMTVNNLAGVLALQNLGFTRVVLAREVTLKDIRHICKNSNVEIEVFAHGALCVCYSGQCLMSSMIGGRSGNRGRCAQPCRLPYTLVDKQDNAVLEDAGQYLLSPKDMNTLELIPELIEAGVASLKLEGRMKKPEYVAVVVDAYRQKIDAYYQRTEVTEDVQKNLSQIFNRDFTTAYLERRPGKLMMSDKRPNNRGRLIGRVVRYDEANRQALIRLNEEVSIGDTIDFWVKVGGRVSTNITKLLVHNKPVETAQAGQEVMVPVPGRVHPHDRVFKVFDARLMQQARERFASNAPQQRIPLVIEAIAQLNQPFILKGKDAQGYEATVTSDFIVEKALKRAMTEETIFKQMQRLGNTIYELEKLHCEIDNDVIVPMSVMNDMRRNLVDELLELRLASYYRPVNKLTSSWKDDLRERKIGSRRPELVVAVDTLEKLNIALDNQADIILFGGDTYNHKFIQDEEYQEAINLCHQKGVKLALGTPRIMRNQEELAFRNWINKVKNWQVDIIYAHSLAQMYLLKENCDIPIWADYSFNTYNDVTLNFLANYGIVGAVVSPELNFKQLKVMAKASPLPLECMVHGYTELMVSEYCVLGSFLGGLDKGKCSEPCTNNRYWLTDRKQERFPVVTDQFCHMHLLNGKVLNMLAHIPEFEKSGISRVRIDARNLSKREIAQYTKLYAEVIREGKGHWALMPENIGKYEQNITRGHYFRGVE